MINATIGQLLLFESSNDGFRTTDQISKLRTGNWRLQIIANGPDDAVIDKISSYATFKLKFFNSREGYAIRTFVSDGAPPQPNSQN